MDARSAWMSLAITLCATFAWGCSSSKATTPAGASDGSADTSDGSADASVDGGVDASAQDSLADAAPEVVDAAPEVLPTACGTASACDPLSAHGCGGAQPACDVTAGVAACRAAGAATRGQACDVTKGPACAPGYHCDTSGASSAGVCRAYCCQATDCVEPGTSCEMTTGLGALGLCTLHAGTYLPARCGVLGPVGCDPFSGAGCDASSTLCTSSGGGSLGCSAYGALLTDGQTCGPSVAASCGLGLTCVASANSCRPWCCDDGDCDPGLTCLGIDTANLGSLGYCD